MANDFASMYHAWAKEMFAQRNALAVEILGIQQDIEAAEAEHGIDMLREKLKAKRKELAALPGKVLSKAADDNQGVLFDVPAPEQEGERE